MHRLGFELKELKAALDLINAQPEVNVSGVYSHLSDSDNLANKMFTEKQLILFEDLCAICEKQLPNKFLKHILNSEGVANFPGAAYDMVRLGIGMYGTVNDPKVQLGLKPVVSWSSSVSQIKKIKKGDAVGYGASFIAEKDMTIAVIPVGYADGFKRILGNGKGSVFLRNVRCVTVGRVCMDMIMVDVKDLNIRRGEQVEIVGFNQTIETFAKACNTITYEILTSISKRVHRVYIED
jgi:alanine racemase